MAKNVAQSSQDQRLAMAKRCSDEGVKAGAKAAVVATIATAIPTVSPSLSFTQIFKKF
ncbi:hypothetical protein F8388_000010 [Cannabis sativa]|uniref:Uncharacterized protein n=1 Tax=Cannabis sativa TaxID=3483 RepID=A0A7J6EP53_CANSA|nr:hypothetical protein F8388_000010 [Cannabis sativa]